MENDPFIVDLPLKHGDVRVGKRSQKKNPEASAGFSSVQFQGDQRLRPNCEHHQPRWTLWQLWPGDTAWSAADHHWSFFP